MTQTKTSYNFLQEHSDQVPHKVNPIKAAARMTDHMAGTKGKYDEQAVSMISQCSLAYHVWVPSKKDQRERRIHEKP